VLRVLIADDNQPVADMLTELIAAPGRIEVVGVADSEAGALEAIRRLRPDVVVLDLTFGTGSGTEVIRSVRADPGLKETRLLVTSNHDSPQMRAGCMGLGADGYFDKVKELGALTSRLDELAEGAPRS
jgi:DNA-binding NarL/FixJ family response regulator